MKSFFSDVLFAPFSAVLVTPPEQEISGLKPFPLPPLPFSRIFLENILLGEEAEQKRYCVPTLCRSFSPALFQGLEPRRFANRIFSSFPADPPVRVFPRRFSLNYPRPSFLEVNVPVHFIGGPQRPPELRLFGLPSPLDLHGYLRPHFPNWHFLCL